jgi:hypothetical protein
MESFDVLSGPLSSGNAVKRKAASDLGIPPPKFPKEDNEMGEGEEMGEEPDGLDSILPETGSGDDIDLPPLPPPDPFKRRKLIILLRAYGVKLAHKLEGIDLSTGTLELKTDEELEKLLAEVRFITGVCSTGSLVAMGLNGGVWLWQQGAQAAGMKVPDLTAVLQKDQEWKDMSIELELKMQDYFEQPLEFRILAKLASATMLLHEINSNLDRKTQHDLTPVSQELEKKWEGL